MNVYAKLFVLLCFAIGLGQLSAQEKKVRIKAEKNVNGVTTKVDTVILTNGDVELKTVMKKLGLEEIHEENGTLLKLHKSHDGKIEGEQKVKVIKLGDGNVTSNFQTVEGEKDVEVSVNVGDGGEKKVVIKVNGEEVSADGEHKVLIEKLENGGKTHRIWVDEDGTKKEFSTTNTFFFNDEELTEEQQAKIEEMKKKMKEGEGNVFFFDENSTEYQLHSGKKVGKNITVDIKSVDGDGTELIKVFKINCVIEEIHEADEPALRKAGISDTKKTLSVDDLSFYPNPNDGRFTLGFETEDKGTVNIRVVDVQGKSVYQETLPSFQGAYKGNIDISSNPQGVYFLSISQNGKVVNKKIVIE